MSNEDLVLRRTALYRHFDAKGRLLYVGITADPDRRMTVHGQESAWVAEAVYFVGQWFDSWDEAHEAEKQAIRVENPVHNSMRYPLPVTREPRVITIQTPDGTTVTF